MQALYDFHIHTTYLKCANETMTIPAILERCASLGLKTIAITDHFNRPDVMDVHLQTKEDIRQAQSDLEIYFGVEVNVISSETGEVSINADLVEQAGFEVVIGGVHSSYHEKPDKRSIIDLQQRLMLQVIANPLIDVLVHPWWFNRLEMGPGGATEWLRDMSEIPDDYAVELGEAAVAHNTAIEANWTAVWGNGAYTDEFKEDYKQYFKRIASTGAKISMSTDAHHIDSLDGIHTLAKVLDEIGLPPQQLWRPEPRG